MQRGQDPEAEGVENLPGTAGVLPKCSCLRPKASGMVL